ncbi:MAG: SMP-30/gluconolactonase/LRE family protein [Pseudomonadota bacterium]|nr:SMP-30/gluconolactonase/LRE family protein [Pseudomonadota bacterium]
MESRFKCVLDVKASLGECPLWSVDEQVLYWADINGPSLNRFDPVRGSNSAWPMPQAIGSFALRAGGGFVAALRDGVWFIDGRGRPERKIAAAPYDPAHHRFNDGRADREGRFWVGSMNEKRDANSARLYRLSSALDLAPVLDDMMISNGLGFSPDGRTMYHADTPARTIRAYDFDGVAGVPSNGRVFAHFDGETDRPDGAAVDSEGCYWSAFYRGGKVVRLSPQGALLAEYALAAMCPTMCAFGGDDLRTLYVTTARQMREADELARLPASGGLFAMRADVAGLPEPKFAG